ncbi:MAG TPA: CocE/NonD family hydrolase [Mycobacteriales bacterium]
MRARRTTLAVVALLTTLGCAIPAAAASHAARTAAAPAPAVPTALPPATYQTVAQDVAITMDDGVQLAATITFPSRDGKTVAPGRFPVVFSMTPYGRKAMCSCGDQTTYPSRGIVSAVVDTRGTGGSEGNLDGNYFSPREARDGYDLTEWFGTQPWSTGKVGMMGGSYVGITQYLTAEQQPPHLAAIAPQVALADLYRDGFTHGGIPNIFFDAQYIAVQGGPGLATPNGPNQVPLTVQAKIDQVLSTPIALAYLARPNDDAFYQQRSPYYQADKITVPVMILDGWRDGFIRGAVEMYHALAGRTDAPTYLHVDPCTHKGCGAPFDPETNPSNLDDEAAIQYAFLSHYLCAPTASCYTASVGSPPVRYYVQGAGHQQDAQTWPPTNQALTLSLVRQKMTAARPAATGTESYRTNPTSGLSMTFDDYGTMAASPYVPTDQRLEDGHGLTWRTAPVTAPVTIAGPTELHLVASSTSTDTDWIAKLADVAPDGSETLISSGYLRASQRQLDPARSLPGAPYHTDTDPQPLTPGHFYDFDIEIWPTAYHLAPGHSLQLRLTSIDVPTHAPVAISLDTTALGSTALEVTPLLPATNTVREGGPDATTLRVPVQGATGGL